MKNEVVIEPVALIHAERLQCLISDPAVAETTSNIPHPYPEGGAAEWIRQTRRQRAEGTTYGFAILCEGVFVGSVSILRVAEGQGEIGYWIGQPFWGQGYATAAGRQVVAFAFGEVGLSALIGKCLVRNKGSYRVLEKLGFQLTGFSEATRPRWAGPQRVAEFVLPRDRWACGDS